MKHQPCGTQDLCQLSPASLMSTVVSEAWFPLVQGSVSGSLARYLRSSSREGGWKKKNKTQGSTDFWEFFPSFSGLWYWEPMMRLLLSLDWFFCLKTQHKTTLPLGNFFSSPFPDRIDRHDWASLVLFQLLPFSASLSWNWNDFLSVSSTRLWTPWRQGLSYLCSRNVCCLSQ